MSPELLKDLDLLLRGTAIGAQLGFGLVLTVSAPDRNLRLATALFVFSNLCFMLNGSHQIGLMLGYASTLLWVIQLGSAAYFWLFVIVLFGDRRISWMLLMPAVALTAIGLAGHVALHPFAAWIWMAHNALGLGLAVHALSVIVQAGRDDLVEARRRLRVPFLFVIAAFSALLSLAQLGQNVGIDAAWYELVNAAAQAGLGIVGLAVMLEARSTLFGMAEGRISVPMTTAEVDTDLLWLARLDRVMEQGRVWQRESLTIADVAREVGLPEYRLRRLINQRLGHRNFNSFVNHHRVAAARALLCDPSNARRSVASIAFDLGYGSLGPFNRAFREAAGVTPTEYRRQALQSSLQIS